MSAPWVHVQSMTYHSILLCLIWISWASQIWNKGFCTLPRVNKTWGFVAVPKTLAGMGHLKKICKDACWVANAIQEIHESDLLGSKIKSVFYIMASKSASRQNGAHFFDISISKKVFRKWCVCAFWLPNLLRANTACTFSTSQLPKVLRCCSIFSIWTSKCASCHSGVQFFMSHLTRWLCRRFSEPTSWAPGATKRWENTVFCDFFAFSHTVTFFLLTLSLLWFSLFFLSLLCLFLRLLFHPCILSEVWLKNFLWPTKLGVLRTMTMD